MLTRPTLIGVKLLAPLAQTVSCAQRRLNSMLSNSLAHAVTIVLLVFRQLAQQVNTVSKREPQVRLMVVVSAHLVTTVSLVLLTSSWLHVHLVPIVRTVFTLTAHQVPLVMLFTVCLLTIVRLALLVLPAVLVPLLPLPVNRLTTARLVSLLRVSHVQQVLLAVTRPVRLTQVSV